MDALPVQQREELAYRLLASLPRPHLVALYRRLTPYLQFDVVGSLPVEIALQIFSYFSYQTLLECALVSRRWQTLADDQSLWKVLCSTRKWEWKQPSKHFFVSQFIEWSEDDDDDDDDDEGMGDEEDTEEEFMLEEDSGFVSMTVDPPPINRPMPQQYRHSAPSVLPSLAPSALKPNYKLLYLTHTRLHARFVSSSYRLSLLQTHGAPANAHTSTIYCLQLYTNPRTGVQTLFTASKDRTVREWDLETGMVIRVFEGAHHLSILSICVGNGYLASAGGDRRVAFWELASGKLVGTLVDHQDSILCVRFDETRLASCSKDRTVRTYSFPDLQPEYTLNAHRAAVNAVSLSKDFIVSGSGDRSICIWDTYTGGLLHTFENHHSRGIASVDLRPPFVLSGSSDKHIRLFDIEGGLQGWSTSPEYDQMISTKCHACGSQDVHLPPPPRTTCTVHSDLVRSVAFGEDFVLSGSYDESIKVWDRHTGALVADLTGGHTGRVFCVGFDCTKIISCGEDQRICIWDFSHGMNTSFIKL